MFYLNTTLITQKGHPRPSVLLRKCGASNNTSMTLLTQPIRNMRMSVLQNLCTTLNCTPNDLLIYKPDPATPLSTGHALTTLAPTEQVDILTALHSLPKSKLLQIQQIIQSPNP